MKRFDVKPNLVSSRERERYGILSQVSELPQFQFRDLSLPHWIHDVAKEFFELLQAEKPPQDPIDPAFKKRRKKKRHRMHL